MVSAFSLPLNGQQHYMTDGAMPGTWDSSVSLTHI